MKQTKEFSKPDLFQVGWPDSPEASFDVDGKTDHYSMAGHSEWNEIPDNHIYAELNEGDQLARGIAARVVVHSGNQICISAKVERLQLKRDTGARHLGNAYAVALPERTGLISSGTMEYLDIGCDSLTSAAPTRQDSIHCAKLVHFGEINTLTVLDRSQVIVFGNVQHLSYRSGSRVLVYGTVGTRECVKGSPNQTESSDLRILGGRHCERIGAVSMVELEPGDHIWQDITEHGIFRVSLDQQSCPVFTNASLHAQALHYLHELVLEVNGCGRDGRETATELALLIEEFARVLQSFDYYDRAAEVLFQCVEILENHLPSDDHSLQILARLYERLSASHAALNCHSLALACATRAECLNAPPRITAIYKDDEPNGLNTSGLAPTAVSGLQPAALAPAPPAVPN